MYMTLEAAELQVPLFPNVHRFRGVAAKAIRHKKTAVIAVFIFSKT